MKRIAMLTTLMLALTSAAHAEEFAKVGTFGGQELKIGVSARATAMGSAFTGVADDATSVFWNAGGLVNVKGNAVSVNHVSWADDTKLSTAIIAFNPRTIPGTFALSVRSFWMDPQRGRAAGTRGGTGAGFDAGTASVGRCSARWVTERFSAGLSVRAVRGGGAEVAVNTGSLDFGIMYRIGIKDLKLGMTIQHLGGSFTFDERESRLPVVFKVGASFNAFKNEKQRLTAALEFQHPNDNNERANAGLEWGLNELFFARAGYHINYDTDGLAFGFGAALPTGEKTKLQADYSAVDMSAMGYVHRFTVSVTY